MQIPDMVSRTLTQAWTSWPGTRRMCQLLFTILLPQPVCSVWAFHDLTEAESCSIKTADFSKVPFRAIFVFHDPRDWALDIQVMLDVIRARGVVGGPYLPHPGSVDHNTSDLPPVEVVFCNPDLIWRSDFERPRLGQGGFKTAFQVVYKVHRMYSGRS
jgi:ribonucleotide monophosphatase NagD (HAD superfamily)